MKKVCIQVGHWGIEGINTAEQKKYLRSWRSTDALRRSTGAGGERDYHWQKVMPLLRDKLISAGIQVFIVDAIYRPEIYNQNYDLWVSLHYDGGGTENRGMVSSPLRDKNPAYLNLQAHNEADRFADIWRRVYPAKTGVVNRNERITAGMLEYYAFDYVPYDTPAVIIEHFNHTSALGEQLKLNPDLVAQADADAIIEFLGVVVKPQPSNLADMQIDFNDPDGQRKQVKWYVSEWWNRKDQVDRLNSDITTKDTRINGLIKDLDAATTTNGDWQDKITTLQNQYSRDMEAKGIEIGKLITKNIRIRVFSQTDAFIA